MRGRKRIQNPGQSQMQTDVRAWVLYFLSVHKQQVITVRIAEDWIASRGGPKFAEDSIRRNVQRFCEPVDWGKYMAPRILPSFKRPRRAGARR